MLIFVEIVVVYVFVFYKNSFEMILFVNVLVGDNFKNKVKLILGEILKGLFGVNVSYFGLVLLSLIICGLDGLCVKII